MAKMIKCPTCGTQIEVPAGPGAQVIKCPGCGKGLKIVAKKPPPPAGQGPGGSLAGTVAGGSVSAMSFHDEPAPAARDDLPSLDYTCQVCGSPTDPDRLIEDNGLLKCPDCIKGARSKVDRPDDAPDLIDFKRPLPAARRGKMIRVTPSLIGGTVAALIFIGCQIYLTLFEEPKGRGRAVASPVQPDKPPGPVFDPDTTGVTTQPLPPVPQESTGADPPTATTAPSRDTVAADPDAPPGEGAATSPTETAANTGSVLFPLDNGATTPPSDNGAPATDPTAPIAVGPATDDPPTTVAIALPTEPLALGLHHLQQRDYLAAFNALSRARDRYRVVGRIETQLTPEQQMVLVGLAAANLGRNQPEAAIAQLDVVLGSATNARIVAKGLATRSAVLNYAIAVLRKPRAANTELARALDLMRQYLSREQRDEYAADIFGTLIERVGAMPGASKEVLQQHVMFLDNYINQLGQQDRPNELKWGIEWKPREQVMQYRAARGRNGAPVAPEQLERDLAAAKTRVLQLAQAVEQARATPGSDVIGAQNQYRDALASQKEIEMRIELAAAPAPKPKWLEKFQPVLPEGSVMQ